MFIFDPNTMNGSLLKFYLPVILMLVPKVSLIQKAWSALLIVRESLLSSVMHLLSNSMVYPTALLMLIVSFYTYSPLGYGWGVSNIFSIEKSVPSCINPIIWSKKHSSTIFTLGGAPSSVAVTVSSLVNIKKSFMVSIIEVSGSIALFDR